MRKSAIKFAALTAVIILVFSAAACVSGDTKPALAVPGGVAVNTDTKTLSWNAVTNASGYRVAVDGEIQAAQNGTTYSLASLAAGTYTLKVKAVGNDNYADSAWSAGVSYTAAGGTGPSGPSGTTEEPGDFNWTLTAVAGEGENAVTAQLKIVLEAAAELDPNGITVSGAADAKFKINMQTGKVAADSGMVAENASTYLIPITANYTGDAFVKLMKGDVKGGTKKIAVTGKFTLPEKTKALNYKGKPEGYTGTVFDGNVPGSTPVNYPETQDLVPYVLDEATGEKTVNAAAASKYSNDYMPHPRPDANEGKGQVIPGLVLPAFYDVGARYVTFNSAGGNAGSGGLNTGNAYKNAFRKGNPVPSTSYIKGYYNNGVANRGDGDLNTYSLFFIPEEWINMMYIGWTNDGEWYRMTVDVQETGIYEVRYLYSMQGNRNLLFSLDFDPEKREAADVDEDTSVNCSVPTTVKTPGFGWGSAHHWNKCVVAYMYLEAGQCVFTLRTAGGPNLCHFDFTKIG